TVGRFDHAFATNDSNLYFCSGGLDSSRAVWNGAAALSPSAYGPRSFWRTPSFRDSTCAAANLGRPDLGLWPGSWAVGPVWADGFVGARVGPPGSVTDLRVTLARTTAVIEWHAPRRSSR